MKNLFTFSAPQNDNVIQKNPESSEHIDNNIKNSADNSGKVDQLNTLMNNPDARKNIAARDPRITNLMKKFTNVYRQKEVTHNTDGSTTTEHTYLSDNVTGRTSKTEKSPGTYDQSSEMILKSIKIPAVGDNVTKNKAYQGGIPMTLRRDLGVAQGTGDFSDWNDFVNKKGPKYNQLSKQKDINKEELDKWIDANLKVINN